jgi:hypothetical protein
MIFRLENYPKMSQPQQSQPQRIEYLYHSSQEDCILSGNFDLFMNGSFPKNKNRIRFKYLPFQRVIKEVVPPMAIDFDKVVELSEPENSKPNYKNS